MYRSSAAPTGSPATPTIRGSAPASGCPHSHRDRHAWYASASAASTAAARIHLGTLAIYCLVTTACRQAGGTRLSLRCGSRALRQASIGSPPHPLDPLPTLRGEGGAPSLPSFGGVSSQRR